MPWLEVDIEKLQGSVLALPNRDQIDLDIKEQLVLERKEVGGLVFLVAFSARTLLAAVTGNKAMSAAKIIDRQKAAIRTDAAVRIGDTSTIILSQRRNKCTV